jgi:hypothetical protein
MQRAGHDLARADLSGFTNELTQMVMRSRILSAVELKDEPFECKVGRDGQNGVEQMNLAGGFAHPSRLSHHLHDLLIGQVVKNSDADDVIEGPIVECESRTVHHHEPAIETGARHLDVVRVDVYSGILTRETASIMARAASDVEEAFTGTWIYSAADQGEKPVGRRP